MSTNKTIVVILLLAATLIFGVYLLVPEYQSFLQLNNELGVKAAQLDPSNAYYAQVASSYQFLSDNKDALVKIDDALPSGADLSKIIYFLQQKAVQSKLTVKNIVLSKQGQNSQNQVGGIKDIAVVANIFGSYESLNQFVTSLEKSDRLFEITNISFTSPASQTLPAGGTPVPMFDFTLQIKTHSY